MPGPAQILFLVLSLPFVLCAAGIWIAPIERNIWFFDWLLTYGAITLSFVGAVHCGAALSQSAWRAMGWSVLPAALGWLALLMNPVPAFSCLAVGFTATYFADTKAARAALLPPWYPRARKPMTLLALAAMSLAIARIATS